MNIRQIFAASAIALATMGLGAAQAAVITPISATGSSSYPGYNDFFAIDTGPNSNNTDWASNGGAVGSYLNLNLGAAYNLSQVTMTDRVTSGGANGGFVGGLYDFTTQFSLQAYDSTFTTAIGSAHIFNPTVPFDPNAPAPGGLTYSDFTTIGSLSGLSGQYIRYTVDATYCPSACSGGFGSNPGLSNIFFEGTRAAVPEPLTLSLFGVGLAGAAAMRRRRKSA